jgi:hypothetical protein
VASVVGRCSCEPLVTDHVSRATEKLKAKKLRILEKTGSSTGRGKLLLVLLYIKK